MAARAHHRTALWQFSIAGVYSVAWEKAPDPTGNVVLAGSVEDPIASELFTVLKLDGLTGSEVRRYEIDGTVPGIDDNTAARAVAVDSTGDVVAVGIVDNAGTGFDAVTAKLSGATGSELWRVTDGSGVNEMAVTVAIDGNDEVKCKGAIGLTLDEPAQGRLAATLSFAGGQRHCLDFADGVILDEPGRFLAKNAASPMTCPVP